MLETSSLHARYGVQIHGVELAKVSADHGYPEIRRALEEHSLLYFAEQQLDDAAHLALAALFGPREDRTIDTENPAPAVSLVSNVKDDHSVYKPGEKKLLDLQANMLWHTDSTFLPVPALINILVGRVIPPPGSFTEFVSTRIAWADMPDSLKNQARDIFLVHEYGHSRRKIDPQLAREKRFNHWKKQIWRSLWTNPENGREALYIASHACAVVGLSPQQGLELIDALTDWCTQDHYIYSHPWKVGDVLIWDERAMLHRGVPWDYNEVRILSSICISATSRDGLDQMRYQPS